MDFKNILGLLGRGSVPGILYSWLEPIWKGSDSFLGQIFNKGKSLFDSASSPGIFDEVGDFIESYLNKMSGAHQTGAEVEQNQYTAMREDSRYQRSVADMQSAGLNPALMYGSGGSAPSVNSSSGGVAGSGSFADFLQLAMLPLQMKTQQAEIANLNSQASLNEANAAHVNQQKEFEAQLQPLLVEARREANNLTRSERAKINSELDVLSKQAQKYAEEAKTEVEKQAYYIAESALKNAEASQIVALMPYREALMNAETEAARAQAAFSAIQVMYQQRLLDSGYLDSMFREMEANAASAESKAKLQDLQTRIRTGQLINVSEDASLLAKVGAGIVNYPVSVVAGILDMASPVIAATLGATAAVKVAGLKNAGKASTSSSLYLPNGTREFGNSYTVR